MKLLIIGAGGHGKVVKEVAEVLGAFEQIEFVDDNSELAIGKIEDLGKLKGTYDAAFPAIGNNKLRRKVLMILQKYAYHIPVLIHPTAYVSTSAEVSYGTIIEPRAIVNTNSKIEQGCIISAGAIVDHDVVVEQCAHVNVGAICKAGTIIAAESKVEAGQVVKGY